MNSAPQFTAAKECGSLSFLPLHNIATLNPTAIIEFRNQGQCAPSGRSHDMCRFAAKPSLKSVAAFAGCPADFDYHFSSGNAGGGIDTLNLFGLHHFVPNQSVHGS